MVSCPKCRRLANSRDDMIIDERRKTAEAEALLEDMSTDVGEPAE